MTEKSCELCKYRVVPLSRNPCKSCDKNYRHFTPIKPNYGSCREGYMTASGDCGVFKKKTPCLQWDCTLFNNEPTKPEHAEDNIARLKWLMLEFLRLMDKYAADPNEKLRVAWHNDIAPALIDRIEARARAAFGKEGL